MSFRKVTSSHIKELDGLRGVAILIVMLFHCVLFGPNEVDSTVGDVVKKTIEFGWSGVDLFFVLSGFLIASILLSDRGNDGWITRFYTKRLFRIMPAYLFVVGVVFLLGLLLRSEGDESLGYVLDNHIFYWTMTHNWLNTIHHDGWFPGAEFIGHLWSLAIEVQFYILCPLFLGRLSIKNLFVFCAVILLACFVARIIMWQSELSPFAVYTNTLSRIDSIIWGVLVALFFQTDISKELIKKIFLGVSVAFCLFIVITVIVEGQVLPDSPLVYIIGFPIISAFYASVLLYLSIAPDSTKLTTILQTKILRTIGKYSFAMYLFHQPLLIVFYEPVFSVLGPSFASQLLYFPFILLLSFVIAMGSWKVIENPSLKLARRLCQPKPNVAAYESN